jgi:hypothetical protein
LVATTDPGFKVVTIGRRQRDLLAKRCALSLAQASTKRLQRLKL